ncbi:hypothetical protein CDCA_CDCA04G1228 [Cyanidium caldarium]|uniref:Twin-arginine translocation signal domain-containing protein n=1 Tax=Cyanidium caldarium TaxID=2771 RepID=A0AAV9ITM0_CYACA|nr:hypothetical protein CDCA_CDCA04G1228 [Cyanidium caldarium]
MFVTSFALRGSVAGRSPSGGVAGCRAVGVRGLRASVNPRLGRRELLKYAVSAALAAALLRSPEPASALPRGRVAKKEAEAKKRAEEETKPDELKELQKQAESIKYDEELYANPDAAEKEVYRTKQVQKPPEYEQKEKELLLKEKQALQDEMRELARERSKLIEEFESRRTKE